MIKYSRDEFLRLCISSGAVLTVVGAAPTACIAQSRSPENRAVTDRASASSCDLREFVRWIREEFEPSIRLPDGAGHYPRQVGEKTPALYGVADMACTLYTIGALNPSGREREDWANAFAIFQDPETGWFHEKPPALSTQHNTAFALAAMRLLCIPPRYPVKTSSEYADPRTFLNSLDWRTGVYKYSTIGSGVCAIFALVPALRSAPWFSEYFATCDSLFDSANGMMGRNKPPEGDIDQVGGTFHYSFLYNSFNRRMPYAKQRIDAVLGLQQPNGYWDDHNQLWMTLDAIFLMTRTLRYEPHRMEDVRASVRRTLTALHRDFFSIEGRKRAFCSVVQLKPNGGAGGGVHSLTAAINIAAEAQEFLGSSEVITEWPLKPVLDVRPYI